MKKNLLTLLGMWLLLFCTALVGMAQNPIIRVSHSKSHFRTQTNAVMLVWVKTFTTSDGLQVVLNPDPNFTINRINAPAKWSCDIATKTCTRTNDGTPDILEFIQVVGTISANAPTTLTHSATLTGGGLGSPRVATDNVPTYNPAKVVQWGSNSFGQLANLPTYPGFTELAQAFRTVAGLTSDGSIVEWGNTSQNTVSPPTGNGYLAISSGTIHTVALTGDGRIVSWGQNTVGQQNGVPTGNGFIALRTTDSGTYALTNEGQVVYWGNINSTDFPTGAKFVDIAGGYAHGIGMAFNGVISQWGANNIGQRNSQPPGGGWKALASASYNGIVQRQDGTLYEWGTSSNNPAAGLPTDPVAAFGASSLSSAAWAMNNNGSIMIWGDAFGSYQTNKPTTGGYALNSVTFGLNAANALLPLANPTLNGGNAQSALVNTAFTTPLSVKVLDNIGNPVPNLSITFTAPASGVSGTFSNNTNTIAVLTGSDGVASATFTANGQGGAYNVTASYPGLDAVSFSLTNIASPTGTSNPTICANTTATLSATCAAGNVVWYDAAGTNLQFTGSPFTTPNLTGNTLYKVACSSGVVQSGFTDVNVSITPTRLYVKANASGANNGSSWADAFTSLQDALAAACSGTEIWVAKGTYKPDQGVGYTPGNRSHSFSMKNGVAIYGGFAGNEAANYDLSLRNFTTNETLLSGDIDGTPDVVTGSGSTLSITGNDGNSYHVISNVNNQLINGVILSGFTVTGGNATQTGTPNSLGVSGGGMLNRADGAGKTCNITINNCTFRGNNAVATGGGIYSQLANGGTMYLQLNKCTIKQNTAQNSGGGITNSSNLDINRCTISENRVFSVGGGMANDNGGTLNIAYSVIDGNFSGSLGGGISFKSLTAGVIPASNITHSTISNNVSKFGAGLHSQGTNLSMTNCLVIGNTSSGSDPTGGAGGLENVAYINNATATLINCSFQNNKHTSGSDPTADDIYSGNFGGVQSTVNLKNTIINGSTTTSTPNARVYTDGAIAAMGKIVSQGNNLDSDGTSGFTNGVNGDLVNVNPLFVSATDARLQACSPAINAGANGTFTVNDKDLDDNARIYNFASGGTIDIGAYEYQAAPAAAITPTINVTHPTTCAGSNGSISLTGFLANTIYSVTYKKNNVAVSAANFISNGSGVITLTGLGAGNYTEIVATYGACVSNEVTANLENPALPTATIVNNNSPICSGNNATFSVNGTNGATLTYTLTDLTSPQTLLLDGTSQTISANNATADVTLTLVSVTKNNCNVTLMANSIVTVLNPAAPVATGATICAGGSATLTATGCVGSGLVLKWYQTADNAAVTMPVSPTVNTQYYAKCEQTLNNVTCASASSGNVTVTVLNPAAPVATGATICAGGSTTLTATGCVGSGLVLKWYQTADNASVTMPVSPTATTQYYAKCEQTFSDPMCFACVQPQGNIVCLSPASGNVTVTVLSPAAPVATGATICAGGSTTLTATGCVGSGLVLKWYQTADNAAVTMPVSPTVNTQYYAKCEQTLNNVTCASASSGNVTVTVLSPATPVATGATICAGGSTTLTATGCVGSGLVLKWYQTADNASVTMPVSPTATTQYYAKCEQTFSDPMCFACVQPQGNIVCLSPASGNVTVTVLSPAAPVATGATICAGGSATLTATGCSGAGLVLKWYQTTDNAPVTMPVSPTMNTQYYAKCEQTLNNVTCASAASGNVTVTVLNPAVPVATGATICTGGSATLTATGCVGSGLVLKWYKTADNAAVTMPVSPTVTTQYYAKCEQTLNNVTCSSAASGNVTVTVLNPAVPVATGATICAGGSVTLTATGCVGSGLVLKWYQTADNAEVMMPVSPMMNTQYYAKCEQTLNNVTCVSASSGNVTVTVLNPAAPVATGATICAGGSTTLTATGCVGSGLVLKWYQTADNAAVTMPVSPTVNTQYYAKCEQTLNNVTCISASSGNVTLTVNPLPTASIGGTTSVCQNAPFPNVTFTGSNGTAPYTFTYKINGGTNLTVTTTSGNSVTVTQSTATVNTFTYTLVSVKDANGCEQLQNGETIIRVNVLAELSFTGANPACQWYTSKLWANTSGTWTANDPTKATIAEDGTISALLDGQATFTFTVAATGCQTISSPLTIKPTPVSALIASKNEVCPNEVVSLDARCSIPTSTVNWNPGGPTVTPAAATLPYIYKARCVADGCVGNESSVEVRTHRILVDMKDLDVGALPLPIVRAVKDNMAPTNLIQAPVFPRRWTFIANGCDASESAEFRLSGPVLFNTIDNTSTYAMFANEGNSFYSIDHPNYGNGGSFPDGTYTLTINLRSKDGVGGPYPKNRLATGALLATRTLEFTVGSSQSIVGGRQSAVVGPSHGSEQWVVSSGQFAEVAPNPVFNTMRLKINESKGQNVGVSLMDASGRMMLQRSFVPETNQHKEEFEVSQLTSGMYFLRVNAENKNATLKVVKTD